MSKYFGDRRKMNKAGDGDGGGGAGATGAGANQNTPAAPDFSKEFNALKETNAALLARLDKLEGKSTKTPDDPGLLEKARLQAENDNKKNSDTKALENAIRFNMQAPDFIKKNESLLPKDVAEIFKAADKETYSTAIEKDQAIKSGIIQSFFSVQANIDLLTPGLKSSLDEYLKLTKTGKQDKAQAIYDGIFEPTFEMLKRIKKADALNKGFGSEDDFETAYKNKLIKSSKSHYLGEK